MLGPFVLPKAAPLRTRELLLVAAAAAAVAAHADLKSRSLGLLLS